MDTQIQVKKKIPTGQALRKLSIPVYNFISESECFILSTEQLSLLVLGAFLKLFILIFEPFIFLKYVHNFLSTLQA